MNLWQGILWFAVKGLFLVAVAYAGTKLGIYLRKRHNDKLAKSEDSNNA